MHRRKMAIVSALAATTVALSTPLAASAAPSSGSESDQYGYNSQYQYDDQSNGYGETGDANTGYTDGTGTNDGTGYSDGTGTTDGTAGTGEANGATGGTGGQYSPEVTQLQLEIEKLNAEMLAAADAANQAAGKASLAKEKADKAKKALKEATAEAEAATDQANAVAADMYMQGPMSLTEQTLLSSDGPQEFIDKAVLGDTVTDYQLKHINAMLAAKSTQQAASKSADEAAATASAQSKKAQKVSSDSQAKLAAAQVKMDALKAEAGMPETSSEAPSAASAPKDKITGEVKGKWAKPVDGTLTSCYCARWGTFHEGIDLANSIGTPIFAAGDGTVMRAGPATGFGLAVYIQHENGDVTVYGHVNEYFVSDGQKVKAGQHIADVGNRGYSTGPHLHFEVTKGMYGARENPQVWLAERGITVE
ncbi:M23 family metallopeptidase [Cumulibacter soli]|uniref:M23 family metallopeptidase n=1 Tax=Cumulibacter soli TaxID=2546344 RepID=UPI0010684453|nr:M23 family metallopeptidase [Cumulibacter soli]